MKTHSRSFSARLALVLMAGLILALPAVGETVDRRLDADPDAEVKISNISGSVTVRGWDNNEVHVTGTLGEGVERLDFESQGDKIVVRVVPKKKSSGWKKSYSQKSADLEIHMPRGGDVDVNVVSASAEIHDLEGEISVEAVSGDVDVEANAEEIQVEVVSGDLDIRGAARLTEAEAVSGDIRIQDISGEVEASTVSGNIEVDAEVLENAELESVSGNIKVASDLAAGAEIEASSHSGNVTLNLPSNTSARFEIETYSGSIDNELSNDTGKKELEFSLGGGSAQVEVETFSGSVRLRNL